MAGIIPTCAQHRKAAVQVRTANKEQRHMEGVKRAVTQGVGHCVRQNTGTHHTLGKVTQHYQRAGQQLGVVYPLQVGFILRF
jgi:Cu/Ag efflux pump CusA